MADSENVEATTAQADVKNKYEMASKIVKNVLDEVILKCVAGAKIWEICRFGDTRINEETSKQFTSKKEIKKGVAFPTTVCVNNIICHYAPMEGETDGPVELADGDMVKIDLGAHLDGFAVVVGHTLVVGASKDKRVEGRKADVILAAHKALEAALRLMRPGVKNMEITDMINRVTQEYKCNAIKGIQSHQSKQFEYDTDKSIVLNPTEEQRKKVEACTLEAHEVWILDIVVSTGEGKAREHESRSNVYKRNETAYQLKGTNARKVYSEVASKFSTFPFHIGHLEDMNKAKFAITECKQHGNIESMDIFEEKANEFVAQFKSTIIVTEQGPIKLSGAAEAGPCTSEHKIQDDKIKELLLKPLKEKKATASN